MVVKPNPIYMNVSRRLLALASYAKGVVLILDYSIRLEMRTRPYK